MIGRKLLAVALAATLLLGGVVATGAATSQDASPANDHAANEADHAPPDATATGNASADASNGAAAANASAGNASVPDHAGPGGEQGPPTDMPATVPDHVLEIHQAIHDFLTGDVDDLDASITEILGVDAADSGADEAIEDADAERGDGEASDDVDADDENTDDDDDAESDAGDDRDA